MAATLLQRPLVLVAHQDDEALGCAILLHRAKDACVVFATDGAPEDGFFWRQYGSRENLATLRRREAETALAAAGVGHYHFLGFIDQHLHHYLREALSRLEAIAQQHRATAVLTHAYEGGHPDHDACSFLGYQLGQKLALEVWEMPLYHRASGQSTVQSFMDGGEAGFAIEPTAAELERKRGMVAAYASQGDVIKNFPSPREIFRRQPPYDYSKPPHPGALNYEAWQWPVTGREVSDAFKQFSRSGSNTWATAS